MSVVNEDIGVVKSPYIEIAGTPAGCTRDNHGITVLFEFIGKLPCLTLQTFGKLKGNGLRTRRGKSFQNRIEFRILY